MPRPCRALAKNLWGSWNEGARALFARVDAGLYERVSENPIAMLVRAPQARLDELANDPAYLADLRRTAEAEVCAAYLGREDVVRPHVRREPPRRRAHRLLLHGVRPARVPPHLLGRPRRARGRPPEDRERSRTPAGRRGARVLRRGTSARRSTHDGWQEERYPINDWHSCPSRPCATPRASAPRWRSRSRAAPRRAPSAQWRVQVGRVPSSCSTPTSRRTRRRIARSPARSTAATRSYRVRQEIMLGIGGVPALRPSASRPRSAT